MTPFLEDIKEYSLGLLAIFAAIGSIWRNEYKTNKVYRSVFDKDDKIKLVEITVFEKCQLSCEQEQAKTQLSVSESFEKLEKAMLDENRRLHDRIDAVPEKVIDILYKTGALKK
jgi:hypothetical protein